MACEKACSIGQRHCLLDDFFKAIPTNVYEQKLSCVESEAIRAVLNDPEERKTAEVFLKCNLNVNAASKELFLHRNTLIYRLEKIKERTGLDLKKFCDAFVFHILMFKDNK
jgi:DNA-binding PucR family transcriptional regulator